MISTHPQPPSDGAALPHPAPPGPQPAGAIRSPNCPTMKGLPPEALQQVAAYFQVLSEPTRLSILNLLREGERNVGDIAQALGTTSANVSRHLALLTQHGLVTRDHRGTSVYYAIGDASVYALCDLVCGNIAQRLARTAQASALFTPAARRPSGRPAARRGRPARNP